MVTTMMFSLTTKHSLLNTPHPSDSKVGTGTARSGFGYPLYARGKRNMLADALSQAPVSTENEIPLVPALNLVAMVMGPQDS